MPLLRSWMFVPGNHERRLQKVKELTADIIIYDLEDAVALSEKANARSMVQHAVRTNNDKVNFVRVNDAGSEHFFDDIQIIAGPGLAGIVLPKAANKGQIALVDYLLAQLEAKHNLNKGQIEIVPLIESAIGLHNAFEIASASQRVKRLAFGSVDYTLDIGAQLTKEGTEILFARSQLVVVSRAAGIEPPIDAVYIHVKDSEGFLRDSELAKQLGFQGKLVIHPDQIGVVNQLFAPNSDEIEEAKAIVAAFDDALASGLAAIQVNGKLVDYPVAERAQRTMEQARMLGLV